MTYFVQGAVVPFLAKLYVVPFSFVFVRFVLSLFLSSNNLATFVNIHSRLTYIKR